MIPVLARTRIGLAAVRRGLGWPVVLVPTMGALHDGHRTLLRRAREISQPNGTVVVSIFVNPLQFGAGEDLDRYPRTLDEDIAVCGAEGAAAVFAPGQADMYPGPQQVTVDPGPMGRLLEGEHRPGHFAGVLTVVLKLFELVGPDAAVFGEKDAQQLALVRRMTGDFGIGIGIASVPIARDPDGLAISSRNRFLSAAERRTALALPQALRAGREAAGAGPAGVLKAAREGIDRAAAAASPLVLDYLALVDPVTFGPVEDGYAGRALLLGAAKAGTTRLIDNVPVILGGPGSGGPCC